MQIVIILITIIVIVGAYLHHIMPANVSSGVSCSVLNCITLVIWIFGRLANNTVNALQQY